MTNTNWFGSKYCKKCDLIGRKFCKCKVSIPLTFPPTMNSDDAIYWINRTQKIFPDQDIKIQIGE